MHHGSQSPGTAAHLANEEKKKLRVGGVGEWLGEADASEIRPGWVQPDARAHVFRCLRASAGGGGVGSVPKPCRWTASRGVWKKRHTHITHTQIPPALMHGLVADIRGRLLHDAADEEDEG